MAFMNRCSPAEVSDPHQPSVEMALAEVAVTRVEPKAARPAAGTPIAPALRSLRRESLVFSKVIISSFSYVEAYKADIDA
ncbi:hypothetical protein RA11412_2754 [Rothia aeria]|uniref:Uncharacterized protein n=1 Tax=Rothia aeria TaxID=172042 RepID=A0A2Z5R2X9_9MICC|nr:hypothetical protein RA11412_2754 [Rothia aeria]